MIDAVKHYIRRSAFFPFLSSFRRMFRANLHPIQRAKTNKDFPLIHLGSEYGGWTFVDKANLKNSVIVSAGLGEDASFDVEFANKYGAKIIIVDPTPRAITHFIGIEENIGGSNTVEYTEGGQQDVGAYDLSKIKPGQLTLVKKAIWNEKGNIRFYSPKNKDHVSHSIINFQHGYSEDTDFIEVEADTLSAIISEQGYRKEDIKLIKLDIEGAEIEVIRQMINEGICPNQILVEFDELNAPPTKKAFSRIDAIHALLIDRGYQLLYTDGRADFLFFKE